LFVKKLFLFAKVTLGKYL